MVDRVDGVDEVEKVDRVDRVDGVDKVDEVDRVDKVDRVDRLIKYAAVLRRIDHVFNITHHRSHIIIHRSQITDHRLQIKDQWKLQFSLSPHCLQNAGRIFLFCCRETCWGRCAIYKKFRGKIYCHGPR